MNITINRAELLSAVQKASAIASEDAPLEPLKGVLLEADAAGTLTLTATNIETSLEQKLACLTNGAPAKASPSFRGERKGKGTQQEMPEGRPLRSGLCPDAEDDALVMNAKLLAGMLGLMSGETAQLRRKPGTRVLTLSSGETVYSWAIGERGEFPKIELPFPEDTVKLSGIPSMARQTMFATKEDKGNPLMRCVNLMFTQEGLKGVGYNGRCLVTAKGDDKSTGNISLLLPANSLEKLADLRRTLKTVAAVDPRGRVKLAFDGGRITFSCKGELGEACQELETAPLTGMPQGGYWYQIPDLMACLRSLSGTATLWIAQAGMLDLSTEGAYYMQTAMREPAATPVVVRETPKAKPEKAAKTKSPKAKSSKAKTVKKAA